MRRPSRQGLLSVCSNLSAGIAKACPQSRKENLPSFVHRNIIPVILLSLFTFTSHGQHLKESVYEFFDQASRDAQWMDLARIDPGLNERDLPDHCLNLLQDSSNAQQEKALEIIYRISSRSHDHHVRAGGIEIFILALSDKSSPIAGRIIDLLESFPKEDFALSSKDTIRAMVRSRSIYFNRIIRLAGYLDLKDLIPDIRPWSQPGNTGAIRWAAITSLARMGDRRAISEMMTRIKRLPVDDEVVYNLFPDLVYSRQREAIDYLVEALQSEVATCQAPDAERERSIPCGYRIMEQLAPVIAGFPIELDESGDLNASDYHTALLEVRRWFTLHKNFTILDDRY